MLMASCAEAAEATVSIARAMMMILVFIVLCILMRFIYQRLFAVQ